MAMSRAACGQEDWGSEVLKILGDFGIAKAS